MPERPIIKMEDFSRLLTETNLNTNPFEWFERNNLDEDLLKALVFAARNGLTSLLLTAISDSDDDDPATVMGNICATMMTAGFAMGWETHKQFGSE